MRRALIALLLTTPIVAQPMKFDGTICRMNRAADRMIIESDSGARLRIVADDAQVTFEGIGYDIADVRPGDRVRIAGNRNGGQIRATAIDARVRAADALAGSLFPSRTIVGRFAVREAQTEFFTLHLPGNHFVRVDAKSAYGPDGRVRVSALLPGDLLELRGEWAQKDLLRASSISVITSKENASCRDHARSGEPAGDTAAREAAEDAFLQGRD